MKTPVKAMKRTRIDMNLIQITMLVLILTAGMAGYANPVLEIEGNYFDPENDILVDFYIEPLSKFLSLLSSGNPSSASDPARIRADADNPTLLPNQKTIEVLSDIIFPAGSDSYRLELDSVRIGQMLDQGILLRSEVYIVLAVYTDNVPRETGGTLVTPLYGTFSPGVFDFNNLYPTPTPTTSLTATQTLSPTPTRSLTPTPTTTPGFELFIDLLVDPVTSRPPEPIMDLNELVDIKWRTGLLTEGATLTLYFDRDNTLEIVNQDGGVIRTINGDLYSVLNTGERVLNNGTDGIEYATIDLTPDDRFPPPPDTGLIPANTYPTGIYRWDFSMIPGGLVYVYGILQSPGLGTVVGYAPYPLIIGTDVNGNKQRRWPVLVGDGPDDRFVHGVAIDDVVRSILGIATELDVVAVSQSGLMRVFDYLGRSWPVYQFDMQVNVDTAPATADVDNDGVPEIVVGTNQLLSDENILFSTANAVLVLDTQFKLRYRSMLANGQVPTAAVLKQFGLYNNFHFLPPGQAVFSTPAIRDIDGDGKRDVVVVSRPFYDVGDSIIQSVTFSSNLQLKPYVKYQISPTGVGTLGEPSVGNIDSDPALEVVLGSRDGKVYAFEMDDASIGAPLLSLSGSTMSAPALYDVDGDGIEEIIVAIAERDRQLQVRAELHLINGDGTPVLGGSSRIYFSDKGYASLCTPVVVPLQVNGNTHPVCLFTTRYSFVGIDLVTGAKLFDFVPEPTANQSFSSSSAAVGQVNPFNNLFEIVLGGGRDTKGNLYGWYLDPSTMKLVTVSGFDTHNEPIFPGFSAPGSILGAPELGDLEGDGIVEVLYTNEDGFVNAFTQHETMQFNRQLIPADFPWVGFKHDHYRSGSSTENPAPIAPRLPGDINGDGVVDDRDLFEVARAWGMLSKFGSSGSGSGGNTLDADVRNANPQNLLIGIMNQFKR